VLFKKALASLLAAVVLAISAAASPCNLPKSSQQCCPCCPAAHTAPQGKFDAYSAQMRVRAAVQRNQLLVSGAIPPDETDSPQLCEGASCNRATALARSAIAVDPAQIVSVLSSASGLFELPERSARSRGATYQLPPTSATLDPLSISLRI
jgi:hypothetical protein